jgi:hypothetical protein
MEKHADLVVAAARVVLAGERVDVAEQAENDIMVTHVVTAATCIVADEHSAATQRVFVAA